MALQPCPVSAPAQDSNLPSDDSSKTIMHSSKRLRGLFKVKEAGVCANCKLADSCTLKNKEFTARAKAPAADLADVFNMLAGVYLQS